MIISVGWRLVFGLCLLSLLLFWFILANDTVALLPDTLPRSHSYIDSVDFWRKKFLQEAADVIIKNPRYEKINTTDPSHIFYLRPPEDHDFLSDVVRAYKYWPDCHEHGGAIRRILADPSRPNVVLDIGGNIGGCTLFYAAHGVKVYSFEPVSENYQLLAASIQANVAAGIFTPDSVIMIPAGASDVEKQLKIYKETRNLGNSIMAEEENGGMPDFNGLGSYDTLSEFKVEYVYTVKIDNVVRERVGFMKMDCQGYEVHAILGAKNLMKLGVDEMYFEFSPAWIRKVGKDPLKLLELLDDYGYKLYRKPNYLLLHGEVPSLHVPRSKFVEFLASFQPRNFTDLWAFNTKIFKNLPEDISNFFPNA